MEHTSNSSSSATSTVSSKIASQPAQILDQTPIASGKWLKLTAIKYKDERGKLRVWTLDYLTFEDVGNIRTNNS